MKIRLRKNLLFPASGLLLALMLFLFSPLSAVRATELPAGSDYGPDTFAETYCVLDGNTGEVLLSRGLYEKRYPASTTKVMTALLTLENVSDLNAPVTFTESAVNIDPSSSTLSPKASAGETMRVIDVLYGMLLVSGNECGAMLGEYVAGSEAAFADMMNRKAAEIGCVNTHFTNAYGIHSDDHYTCAYDLCLILKAAMDNARFCEIMRNVTYTIPATNVNAARSLRNSHQLLNGTIECEGVIGGKTGSTPQAGRTLVTAVKRNGLYTVSSLMKSSTENYYCDEQVLLEYAYGLKDGSIATAEVTPCVDTVTATENVKIRCSPSMYGAEAGTLNSGESLQRTGTIRGWSRVSYNGRNCYVSSAYLTPPAAEASGTEGVSVSEAETEAETETAAETETDGETGTVSGTKEEVPQDTPSETRAAGAESSPEGSGTGEELTGKAEEQDGESAGTQESETSGAESGGMKEVFSKMMDTLMIILPAAVIAVFSVIWVLLLVRLIRKKNREEKRRQHLREMQSLRDAEKEPGRKKADRK